ncbi:uncharacterized protein LOC118189366 [Stegodyphus dumicola]|uniref:uncharacterized protein LOC118189366 n=1 Tax=Stegodyphus dumicola TaxID=202533 RepID=UPI0015B1DF72|nr:uncharacterized protein LOC118189366 [Stegodyphus dumicola]
MVYSHPVRTVSQLKYLGVIIDNRLNWIRHLHHIHQKVVSLTNNMRRTTGMYWGIRPDMLKIWYRTITAMVILYGSSAWGIHLNGNLRMKLSSIQRLQLLMITKAYRTTSTDSLQVLAGLLPLDLVVDREAAQARILRIKEDFILWGTNYRACDYEDHSPRSLGHPADINYDDKVTIVTIESLIPARHEICLYTDGSKTELGTGSGFCVMRGNTICYTWSQRLSDYNSVFQAELVAIKAALDYIKQNLTGPVRILSDSTSSLLAIKELNSKADSVHIIRDALLQIPESQRPYLSWVPAHVGIAGNEEADRFAKLAANDLNMPDYGFKVLMGEIIPPELQDKWKQMVRQLCDLPNIQIPRWYFCDVDEAPEILELRCFCDLSQSA